jgi:hypothetical protein
MSTGLIEGWQHFTDTARQDQPLLSAPQWLDALAQAGFKAPGAWPDSGSPAAVLGQHVVIGRVEGVSSASGRAPKVAGRWLNDASRAAAGAQVQAATETSVAAGQLRHKIVAALPVERAELLREFVRREVMQVLRRPADDPPGLHDRLMDLGIDSLMAVQLRGQLGTGLGLAQQLPATLMFDHPSIAALAEVLAGHLDGAAEPAARAAGRLDILDAEDVAALSEAEIEALVIARLQEPMT